MEEEEDEVDTWVVVVEEVEAGEADEAAVEEVRFFSSYFYLICVIVPLFHKVDLME